MGLPGDDDDCIQRPTFSKDVLRLEIAGPLQEHLSVIDAPGILKSTPEGLTTKADISLVREMLKGYTDNARSVMLAVLPANTDLAIQEILDLASDVDEHGGRTLGVLTKPDLVDKDAERDIIDLLEGRAHPMELGWHVIRNSRQQQSQDPTLERDNLEKDLFLLSKPLK